MIIPKGTSFVFVGKLASMTRDQARILVESKGGICPSALAPELDYLVVGNENSPLYGGEKKPKQIKAEAMIDAGAALAIIDENEFLGLLGEATPAELEAIAESEIN